MLKNLLIRNLVLVIEQEIQLPAGLIMLTGETGAGKSVILSAFNLLFGGKAEPRMIRHGADQMEIIGQFDQIHAGHPLYQILSDQEIALDEDLMIRRVVKSDGKSRAFINNVPVNLNFLAQMGEYCTEIQSQGENQALLNPQLHLGILDKFGRHQEILSDVHEKYDAMILAKNNLTQAINDHEKNNQDWEYWVQSYEELVSFAPKIGEEAWLDDKRRSLQQMEKNLNYIQDLIHNLQADDGIFKKLRNIGRITGRLPEGEYQQSLQDKHSMLENTASDLLQIAENTLYAWENTEDNIVDIEDRLFQLRELGRKYRKIPDELPDFVQDLEQKLQDTKTRIENIPKFQKIYDASVVIYQQSCANLTAARTHSAEILGGRITPILHELRLPNACVRIDLVARPELHRDGMERAQFMAVINPKQPFDLVHKIASGGELSRLLLAIKNAMALNDPVQTMVFDEIDSGVGGATAAAIGKLLYGLSRHQQVFVITHSPQVAAKADCHLRVEKSTESGVAVTQIRTLSMVERIEEIARMLSSEAITPEARTQAKHLIES